MQGETDACTQLLQTPFRGGDTASCNTPDTQKLSTTFSHQISKVTTQFLETESDQPNIPMRPFFSEQFLLLLIYIEKATNIYCIYC